MKTLQIILIILLLGLSSNLKADGIGYSMSLKIEIESKDFVVIHFHDWTDKTREDRYKMIFTNQDPFSVDNNYSYIECINKNTGKTVFKKPCPALTKIQISSDQKYIIGISKVMLWNPYQLVIFDTGGNLIKKRNISSEEAKLNSQEFEFFKTNYKTQFRFLDSLQRVYKVDDNYFIDFSSMGMPDKLGDAWKHLFNHISNNHLSDNFSASVTNWIFWFYEESPDIQFNYFNSELISISLFDPKKQRFEIRLNE
jgi:hypothetical protein